MKSQTRHLSRQEAFQTLYEFDLKSELNDNLDVATLLLKLDPEAASLTKDLLKITLDNLPVIDKKIQDLSTKWKIQRLPAVDRSILRLALGEILFYPETPAVIAIDEAVELAKRFGTDESGAFINGLLDHARKLEKSG